MSATISRSVIMIPTYQRKKKMSVLWGVEANEGHEGSERNEGHEGNEGRQERKGRGGREGRKGMCVRVRVSACAERDGGEVSSLMVGGRIST